MCVDDENDVLGVLLLFVVCLGMRFMCLFWLMCIVVLCV